MNYVYYVSLPYEPELAKFKKEEVASPFNYGMRITKRDSINNKAICVLFCHIKMNDN